MIWRWKYSSFLGCDYPKCRLIQLSYWLATVLFGYLPLNASLYRKPAICWQLDNTHGNCVDPYVLGSHYVTDQSLSPVFLG